MSRTTIIFVRHAQSVYGSDDRNRPLTEDFLRIVRWMPYVIEMVFEGEKLLEIRELAYVDKN